MHFEILVEGQTELTALSILLPKIISEYNKPHTWKIHKHRGIGQIPDNPQDAPNKNNPTLLHNLPAKLRAYGKEDKKGLVIVVLVDLDDRDDCIAFKNELVHLLRSCEQQPCTLFRIAIEELEAWYLGDIKSITNANAYPKAILNEMKTYTQDSQCGTWEKLADVIYPGGRKSLEQLGKRSTRILEQKGIWAKKICPHMDVENNLSSSFQAFRNGIRQWMQKDCMPQSKMTKD